MSPLTLLLLLAMTSPMTSFGLQKTANEMMQLDGSSRSGVARSLKTADTDAAARLQWLAPFNPDWQTAVQSGLPMPTFQNVNFACNATLLERAYNQTGVPGFLSLQNCPVPFGGIWRYYVSCDQHGHCIPINGTQSGLQPTWERTLEMILEPVLHMFVAGPLVGVFLVR